jgi:hypothetical protein
MGRINMARVVLGGLLAGLIINVGEFLLNGVLLGDQVNATLQRLNLPPIAGSTITVFVVNAFLLGIAAVWLYAAIRPRYGAGPKTALCAGAAVWFLSYVYPGIGMTAMGMFPTNLMVLGTIWGLVELLVATVAGAWLYQEGPEVVTAKARA